MPFTTAATDDEAFCTSDKVASEPDVRPAAVRVRDAALQTSVASVPNEERVRTDAFQTFTGIEVAKDEDAARIAAFVLALMTAASEEVAVVTVEFVLALIAV